MPDAPHDLTEINKTADVLAERERLALLISDVSTELVRGHDLDRTLKRCCEALVEYLDAALARIWTFNEQTNVLELQASAGIYTHLDGEHSRIPLGKFKIGKIAQERQPHLTNDVLNDSQVSNHEWAKEEKMVAFAGFPLVVEDRLVGVVAIFSRSSLSDAMFKAVATIADSIGLGIERCLSELKLKSQTEILESIQKIGRVISGELDQKNLVQAVTDAATELTGAEFGAFFYNVLNEDGALMMLYALSGVPREAFAHFPMPRATDIFGPTFLGQGTVRFDDVKESPHYGKNSPYKGMPHGHLPVTSYLAVSVISRSGDVIGGLFFGHSNRGVFTERHENIVEGLAAQTAIAMDNAALYEKAQNAIKEHQKILQSEKESRRQAEIANRTKDEFLGLLSHELRTPLNAILGWTRLINTGQLDDAAFERAIETIDRNAKLQGRLIEDMLDVSRIISGKLRLDAHPVDLTTVINSAVDTSRPAADAKQIHISTVLDFGAGMVLGDPVRLQQVIWNLLANAIKFTPKNGKIQIQMERVNSHIEISVSDTGTGIDDELLPYIFDRFKQGDSSASKKYGGLGLGLSIVRHLVELHGGTVEAHNRKEGSGAVFLIDLPVMIVKKENLDKTREVERIHPTVSGAVPFECPPELNGIKVLAVDDEADARILLTAVLEQCGAEVKTCSTAQETLDMLEVYTPDVLVSDIGMPDEDGYSLIKKVRQMEDETEKPRIPAIALTAFARVEDRLRAFSAGYNMHVPKPVEPAELALVIASLTAHIKK